jgi:uncharacterized Fe-S radical SAM superfamily protein PflX
MNKHTLISGLTTIIGEVEALQDDTIFYMDCYHRCVIGQLSQSAFEYSSTSHSIQYLNSKFNSDFRKLSYNWNADNIYGSTVVQVIDLFTTNAGIPDPRKTVWTLPITKADWLVKAERVLNKLTA